MADRSAIVQFQSTLPRGERRLICTRISRLLNFNPRSHEGSDVKIAIFSVVKEISIHAPTRGATRDHLLYGKGTAFQSTLPRGERLLFGAGRICLLAISIHAPTRGATDLKQPNMEDCIFQSTLPRGERRFCIPGCGIRCYFNPRSHEGSDCTVNH